MTMDYTIQQIARRAGVRLSALSGTECSDDDLLTFAPQVGESWNLIGQSLRLTKEQLSAIEGTITEKRVAVLQKWKESTLDATYQVLAEAFLVCKRPRSALKLCEHFKEKHPTAALSPNETLGKECDQGTGEQNLTAEKVPTPSTSTQNVDISDMNPESLAEWLVKEIGELYLADINKLKEKYVGGALFLSLYPASACKELLKKLDLTPEGETILLKTVKEFQLASGGDQNKCTRTEDGKKGLNKSDSQTSVDHNQLIVCCLHKDKGCQWQGKYEKLQEHLSPDLDNELPTQGCGYVMMSCSHRCGTQMFRHQIQEHETECCPKLPMEVQVASIVKKFDIICRKLSETQRDYENMKKELSVMKTEHDLMKKRFPIPPIQCTMYNIQDHIQSENRWTSEPFYSHFAGYKMRFDTVVTQISKTPGNPVIIKYFIFITQGEFDSQLVWPFSCEVIIEIYNHTKQNWDHACKIQVNAKSCASELSSSQEKPCEVQYNFLDYFMHYLKENSFWFRISSVDVKNPL